MLIMLPCTCREGGHPAPMMTGNEPIAKIMPPSKAATLPQIGPAILPMTTARETKVPRSTEGVPADQAA